MLVENWYRLNLFAHETKKEKPAITAVTSYCSIFLAGTFSSRKNYILVEKTRFAFPQQDVAANRYELVEKEHFS